MGFSPVATGPLDRVSFPRVLKMNSIGAEGGSGCCQREAEDGVQESENQATQKVEAEMIREEWGRASEEAQEELGYQARAEA